MGHMLFIKDYQKTDVVPALLQSFLSEITMEEK